MKKFILLALLIVSYTLTSSQEFPKDDNGKVEFTRVLQAEGWSANDLFSALSDWAHTNRQLFQRSNEDKGANVGNVLMGTGKSSSFAQINAMYDLENPVSVADKDTKKIIINVVDRYTGSSMGCPRVLYIEYVISIKIKENRFKYSITNFTYKHYNFTTAKQQAIYGREDGACGSYGTLEALTNCTKCKKGMTKFYTYLTQSVEGIISDMGNYILEYDKNEDDW
jgi:hypothetical protein